MANEETALKAAIIQAVNASGLAKVWNCPSGKVKVRGGWVQLAPEGTADIVGYTLNGATLVALEVKTKTGKTKPERAEKQLQWRQSAAACGAIVAEVRSVDEALAVVRSGVSRAA